MTGFAEYLQSHWLIWLGGGSAAILTWIVTNWLGKPLLEFLLDRRRTLEALQVHGGINLSSEERVKEAWKAIDEVAARMMFYAQAGPWIVRTYCRLRRYELARVGLMLNGVHNFIGQNVASATWQNQCDAVRFALGATGLMTAERRNEIRIMLREAFDPLLHHND